MKKKQKKVNTQLAILKIFANKTYIQCTKTNSFDDVRIITCDGNQIYSLNTVECPFHLKENDGVNRPRCRCLADKDGKTRQELAKEELEMIKKLWFLNRLEDK